MTEFTEDTAPPPVSVAERPEIAYLGTESGESYVVAFTDTLSASRWATSEGERYVWPVVSLQLGEPLKALVVPASVALVPVEEYQR